MDATKIEEFKRKSDEALFGDELRRVRGEFPEANVAVQRYGIQREVDEDGQAKWVIVGDAIIVPVRPGRYLRSP